jgi:hypothetical protein
MSHNHSNGDGDHGGHDGQCDHEDHGAEEQGSNDHNLPGDHDALHGHLTPSQDELEHLNKSMDMQD